MATGKSGTLIWTTGNYSIRATWSETYDIESNTSKVSISKLEAKTSAYSNVTYYPDGVIQINGKTVKTLNSQTPTGQVNITAKNTWFTISNTSCSLSDIAHSSDGSKSIAIKLTGNRFSEFSFFTSRGGSGSGWGVSSSKTITLTTIPRASSITSVSNVTLGNACGVEWTPLADSYKYKLKFKLGNWSYTTDYISPGTTSAYTYTGYTIPLEVANQITSATTGTMTVYLYTYNGSTQIGTTASETFTVTVPTSMIPTIDTNSASIEIDNSENSTVASWEICVVGYSKIKVSATATGSYGSTISSFAISGGYTATKTGTSLSYTGEILKSSGEKSFNVIAKDSRGRTSDSVTAGTIIVYAYTKPKITTFTVSRDETDASQIIVNANWEYAKVGENQVTTILKYKDSKSTSWTTYSGDITSGENIIDVLLDKTTSYDFQFQVTDSLSEVAQAEAFISTMQVLLDFRAGGKGLGIGKISESDTMEVGMDATFFNPVTFENKSTFETQSILRQGSYVHYTEGEIGVAGYANVAQIICKSEYADTPIVIHTLQRCIEKNTYSIRFANDRTNDPSVASFAHDGNTPAYLVKSGTSTWDLYILKAQAWDNICITQLENSYYVNSRIEIVWKDGLITELPTGYIESVSSKGYKTGKTITVDIRTAGYATNASKEVHFTVPLSKEIIVPTAVTAASVDGFCLRQNNAYTHGSSATVYAKPSSYAAYIDDYGVRIVATFSTTTNAVNNAPIGVHWSGTITFS